MPRLGLGSSQRSVREDDLEGLRRDAGVGQTRGVLLVRPLTGGVEDDIGRLLVVALGHPGPDPRSGGVTHTAGRADGAGVGHGRLPSCSQVVETIRVSLS